MHGGGNDPRFHEIQGHSPSPAFIKLNSFGWNICFYKVLGGFSHEICHISWNPVDFMWNRKTNLQEIVTLWFFCFDTIFIKRMHIRSWCPPMKLAPPSGKSWMHHWLRAHSHTAIVIVTAKAMTCDIAKLWVTEPFLRLRWLIKSQCE